MAYDHLKNLDNEEIDLPDTVFVWDIENRVFQSIALQCLAQVKGVALLEGSLFDAFLGRDCGDRVKGIHVEQDQKGHTVNVRVEVNVAFGTNIPKKAEEIQVKIAEQISNLTGLHVGSVHVIFKNLIPSADLSEKEGVSAEED